MDIEAHIEEAKKVGAGQKKHFCGHKNKFGLNCQAVSNCHSHILNISMKYSGASADCLAFEGHD